MGNGADRGGHGNRLSCDEFPTSPEFYLHRAFDTTPSDSGTPFILEGGNWGNCKNPGPGPSGNGRFVVAAKHNS